MADIRPFRAIRYKGHHISSVVAPPYDILDVPDKDALLTKSNRNIVAVDLPHCPAKQAGPPAAYESAARTLQSWVADGTLAQDRTPALYVYHQIYTHGGRGYTRRMFFARLRLEEFGKGQVFPHEQTFGGPKEDRLLLTRATRCNLSPIFGLYPDRSNSVAASFNDVTAREPDAVAHSENVENRLWAVTDASVVRHAADLMRELPVFIADGHHRYGTALNYRAELSKASPLTEDHPANFVLCVLAGMEDPGLLILPTHRVLCDLPNVTTAELKAALGDRFEIAPAANAESGAKLTAGLNEHGPLAMAVFAAADSGSLVIRPRDADLLAAYEPNRAPAWRRYGLAMLHRFVIDEVMRPRFCGGQAPNIHYIKDANAALAEAREQRGVAFLPQPTTMSELRDICTAGELMPQKSTYFFPKLATGMVINPLSD